MGWGPTLCTLNLPVPMSFAARLRHCQQCSTNIILAERQIVRCGGEVAHVFQQQRGSPPH